MKDCNGEDLVALAGAASIKIADCVDIEGLGCLLEFLGLLRHNLEIIKFRRFINKVEKVEKKIEEQKK